MRLNVKVAGFIVLILVGVFVVMDWKQRQNFLREEWATLRLKNGVIVQLEIANTPEKRERGLSGRASLEEGRGMIFLFDRPGRHGFWMKEMKFALDFIWMNGERVVELTADVPPPGEGESPVRINPIAEVDRVIEVPAGFNARQGLKKGDRLSLDGPFEK